MYYDEVFEALNKGKVRYLVVGGVALVLHGVVRLTVDLDLFLDMTPKNLTKFIKIMGSLRYKPRLPVKALDFADVKKRERWVKEKNMKVFSFIHSKDSYKMVDAFAEEPISFKIAYDSKKMIKAGNIQIPVISIDDLIKLKKSSGRPQDLEDVKTLIKLRKIK